MFWIVAGALTALCTALVARAVMPRRRLSYALTVLIPLTALGLYLGLGRPELTAWHTRPALPPVIAGAVKKLQAGLAADPKDKEAWILLGDVYRKVDRTAEAADAYGHALALDPADPALKAALAEMMVKAAGGRVEAGARDLFAQAPDQPAARYYLALAEAQGADWPDALKDWQALAASSPPDAPWQDSTAARIAEARRALGLDEQH
jgi:cytochrome c-type biogenesis protein CcmH